MLDPPLRQTHFAKVTSTRASRPQPPFSPFLHNLNGPIEEQNGPIFSFKTSHSCFHSDYYCKMFYLTLSMTKLWKPLSKHVRSSLRLLDS